MDVATQTQTHTLGVTRLPDPVLAQAAPGPGNFFPFVLVIIFLIFYVLVIRPNTKAQKAKEEAIQAATKGDDVVTVGGIHGKVTAIEGEVFEIEVARLRGEKVKLRIDRAKIDRLEKAGTGGDAAESKSDKSEKGAKGKGAES